MAEIQGPAAGSRATVFIVSIVVLCMVAAGFVLALTIVRPEKDNAPTILLVFGLIAPVITALLAGVVQSVRTDIQSVHLAVNGRLSQLLELTARASQAEGVLKGAAAGAAAGPNAGAELVAQLASPDKGSSA